MMTYLRGLGGRVLTIVAVTVVGSLIALFLMSGDAIYVPGMEPKAQYRLQVASSDADNLVPASMVRVAGVQVGEVESMTPVPKGVELTFSLWDEDVLPLHEGVKVEVSEKSLVGESYLAVTDGNGPPIPTDSALPSDAAVRSVQLHDVYRSLDPETRRSTSELIQSLDASTTGTREELSATVAGLGALGRQGHTALDAVAAQGQELRTAVRKASRLLEALDTGQGQIATLVSNANRLTAATAGQRQAVEDTMRLLPGVLNRAGSAADALTGLSGSLTPVAANLREAAPSLTPALRELPAAAKDIRGLLAPLSGTLDRAPATLDRVPSFSADVRELTPATYAMLREINPMLDYMQPYGRDLAAYFANFNATVRYKDSAGTHYARIGLFMNEEALQSPVDAEINSYENPYPKPGQGADPGPFTGRYPRVERAPR